MKTKIDFKKELETASRGMIMIHDPKLLIKLIVRMLVRKLGLKHGAMILYDDIKNSYVLSISRGETGTRIPAGFTRFTDESPIIKLFKKKDYRDLTEERHAIVLEDISRLIWREGIVKEASDDDLQDLLYNVEEQMQMLNVKVCVPAYYRHDLMAVLILGDKRNNAKYRQDELDFIAALASDAAMAIRNGQLFIGLKKEAERNRKQYIQTISVLGSTIEAKDAYTRGHVDRVTKYALAIARRMQEKGLGAFDKNYFENLYISSILHDIGKIGVSEAILNKNGPLTEEEFEEMKRHPQRGHDIVRALDLPQMCMDGILFHHEAYDGRGYPMRLVGDQIPMVAAIISVADALDAMTSDRPYRKALPKEVAFEEIEKCRGKQFHPVPADIFLELFAAGEI